MIDLTSKLMEQFQPQERDSRRISVTDIHAILNSWEDRPIDIASALRMWQGTWKHKMIQELLPDYEHEKKLEYPYKDITVVGKADCLSDDHILEIKTSENLLDKAKEWHYTQALIYCTMFERAHCYIVQPAYTGNSLYLKKLRKVGRNDDKVHTMLGEVNDIINFRLSRK